MNHSVLAINALGLDLLTLTGQPDENTLLSPYSIQCALAMAYAGADGITKAEMAKALHYYPDETELHLSFAALQQSLEPIAKENSQATERTNLPAPHAPVTLAVANRLFGQVGYDFQPSFLSLLKQNYRAPFEPLDFLQDSEDATATINRWVEEQTRQRIRDFLPPGTLPALTRLALVNAIYLKAQWEVPFEEDSTKPLPFHLASGKSVKVPTMVDQRMLGYLKKPGMTLLDLPYTGCDLHCLIFLPDANERLRDLEQRLNPEAFDEPLPLARQDAILYLPKFRIEPPLLRLGAMLRTLGMKSAFNEPSRSANFDRMAPRRNKDYLYLSDVFHKTFLDLDEYGTEAAAATIAAMWCLAIAHPRPKPIEVHVDRPFIFSVVHAPSGACLFLGRVADPR